MKKVKKDEVKVEETPKVEDAPKESGTTFDKLDQENMEKILVELSTTIYWQAIVKLITTYDLNIMNAVLGLDPNKQATDIARYQGQRVGLYYLNGQISEFIAKRQPLETPPAQN